MAAPRRIPNNVPVYELLEPFVDPADVFHEAGKIIKFSGTPNQGMMPLNELAKKAYDEYMDKLDEGHKAFCAKQEPPIPFVPHARIYEHQEDEIPDVSDRARLATGDKTTNEMKLGRRGGAPKEGASAL